MPEPTKHFWTVLCSLLVLRLIVGCHFFSEGASKIRSGTFSCTGFLSNATGPFSKHFQYLLDDHDGRLRLCLDQDDRIDVSQTFAIWDDFVQSAAENNSFDEQQNRQAQQVLAQSKRHLQSYLMDLEPEIIAWFNGAERLTGFRRDGEARTETVNQVESLHDQVNTIKRDRDQLAKPWLTEVELTWDELEARVNRIAGLDSANDSANDSARPVKLSRPYAQPWSAQFVIDRFLPWFDVTVGGLLILGLFSRMAAVAGIGLLLGVVATQPFWVLGATNTYYQWIEIAALAVLFATAAGRFGGLDYFLTKRMSRNGSLASSMNSPNSVTEA